MIWLLLVLRLCFCAEKLVLETKIPHSGYSEGLEWHKGYLWNATPKEIVKIDPKDGTPLERFMPATEYSEGVCFFKNAWWNLSFKDNGLYKIARLPKTDIRGYKKVWSSPEEHGWGITHVGDTLVVTGNFSDKLYFISPTSFQTVRTLSVSINNLPLKDLEDLDFDGTYLWTSTFLAHEGQYQGTIFAIDIKSGNVLSQFELPNPAECPVIDGIASEKTSLWLTGKNCPSLYKVKNPLLK